MDDKRMSSSQTRRAWDTRLAQAIQEWMANDEEDDPRTIVEVVRDAQAAAAAAAAAIEEGEERA